MTIWNERFSGETYVYGKEANVFIKEKASLLEQGTVACFAEGEGRNAVFLAERGLTVTALDNADTGLEKASALAGDRGLEIDVKKMDLTLEAPERESFDHAIMVFGHVPKSSQAWMMRNILASVRPGGVVLLEVYSEDQLDYGTGGPPDAGLLYDPEDILTWIRDHHVLHFYYGEADRVEGEKHTGRCHLIQAAIRIQSSI
ncbi:SAM-dependent methyltransferase [Alkalicoccus urumqiensis]|uniref:SAM-dependent methyltransferase n=2 Tax=Alkalicoccus urumqiensis TaxID=1548213 RepID=A0A2P6MIT6_ALKUR|nr:SAM-dependent methyltransferase [Alkalicoccus urumqiensis]